MTGDTHQTIQGLKLCKLQSSLLLMLDYKGTC